MEPLFRKGDTVTVACGPLVRCHPGDVICFRRGASFVLHRLIEQEDNGKWLEKGDAEVGGSWIDPDCVIGCVTRLNGLPLADAHRKATLRWGRVERRVSAWRRRFGLPRLPARWTGAWRYMKVRCFRRRAGS